MTATDELGRMRNWSVLRYCTGIFLEGLRKTARNLMKSLV
jgi:hypothetical protein